MNFHLSRMSGFAFAASTLLSFSSCKKDADKQLAFSQNSLTTGTAASEQSIGISANVNWTLTIPEEAASWISVDKINGASATTVKISVAINTGNDPRNATLTLKSEGVPDASFTITQKGRIESAKDIPNLTNNSMLEVADGYIIAGRKERSLYIYKVNKTDFTVLKSKSINIAGYSDNYQLWDMEPMPGGGIVIAAQLETGPASSDAYFAQLDNDLNVVKEKSVTFFEGSHNIPVAITPVNGGFLVALNVGARGIAKLDPNFNIIPGIDPQPATVILDLKLLQNGEIIAAGRSRTGPAIMKYKDNLELLKTYTAADGGLLYSICITTDQKIVAGGYRSVNFVDTALAVKLDANLDLIHKTDIYLPTEDETAAYTISPLTKGGYAVSGRYGTYELFSTQINENFQLLPEKAVKLPNSYLEYITASAPHSDGGYVITGHGKAEDKSKLIHINP